MADPYFSGKMFAKIARLALIADELGEVAIRNNFTSKLKSYLTPWLNGTLSKGNHLVFDRHWKGVISCGCRYDDCYGKCTPHCANGGPPGDCPAFGDQGFDFGNGFYNDHHFHYGYFIYSAAAIARFDSEWAMKFNDSVLTLIRDIANPSENDPYFPQFRMMDFYVGHSWASGIVTAGTNPFMNGKDQESTSEAVNAWYAISLFGDATKNEKVKDLGRTLLSTELIGTHHYWQIRAGSQVYPSRYQNIHVFGIVWQHLAQFQTFFSGDFVILCFI